MITNPPSRAQRTALLVALATMSLLLFTGAPSLLAGGKKTAKEDAGPEPTDKITVLDLTSVTVTLTATHSSVHYRVTPETKVMVNGAPGTLSHLATGMDVHVTPSANPSIAAEIVAKTAAPPVKREPPKKKR